jgi:hypothetical protein
MAFTQKPGRQSFPKTGHGIPSPLLQQKTATTDAYIATRKADNRYSKKELESSKNLASGAAGTGLIPGTSISSTTGQSTANAYEKKLVTQPSGDTFMVDGSGKTIKSAKYNPHGNKDVEALKKEYDKQKAFTEDSRTANAKSQNFRASLSGGFTRRS